MSVTQSVMTLYDVEFTLEGKTLPPFVFDFPDIEATAKAVSAPPTRVNADGKPGYTVPFITVTSRDKPTLALSDSVKIAQHIGNALPNSEYKLLPIERRVFQSVFSNYLFEKVAYPVFRLCRSPQDEASIAKAWKDIDAGFDGLSAHLNGTGEGNFRITGGMGYVEFELISILNLVRRLSFDEGWKRLKSRNGGGWAKLMDIPVYRTLLRHN